jgi:hypothetical protein
MKIGPISKRRKQNKTKLNLDSFKRTIIDSREKIRR